ncbi:CaiB/BaiF CoA transferase family protein [uncultured Enterovirga sp.]|uniref:CaiB/BaiF CoA transferase family protein n=1 Tax=uncultured Enterovirga sp. TaxID=2026352 RepID=UPI0035CAAB9F
MRPLEGLFVLDFSTLLPGPMAGLLLAEAGAEVVKVEREGSGEEMRGYAPLWGGDGVNFALLNRGKKSIALNLKDEAARAKLLPLVEKADILLEQFRPGAMARLGLDYATLSGINPRLIYCSITGYGQTGPKLNAAGHDLNYIGDSGLLALSMGEPSRGIVPPALIADIAGGAYPAVINILLALRERDRTGVGCHLDIAMTDNLFPFTYWAMGNGLAAGEWPGNGTDLVTGGSPRYQLYGTADGRVVAAAPLEQKFWVTFCELIGLDPALRDDSRDPDATRTGVAALIARETGEHWRALFAGKDCCCSVVATIREAMDDPHFQARGLFDRRVTNFDGQSLPALPVPIAPAFREDASVSRETPGLGAHNQDYLR